jgi:hypothetical protein
MMKCPVGTYGDTDAAASKAECKKCKAGKYCNMKGKVETDFSSNNCADGFLCSEGSKVANPSLSETGTLCSKGQYCRLG